MTSKNEKVEEAFSDMVHPLAVLDIHGNEAEKELANKIAGLILSHYQDDTQFAAGKPVYQVENGGVWEDVSEQQQARCQDLAYRTRTLWTAPPAAAPVAAGEPVSLNYHVNLPKRKSSENLPYEGALIVEAWNSCIDHFLAINPNLNCGSPAAAHGDEAVRKNATESAIQRACRELPEGWSMQIELERGAGDVTLFNAWDIVVDFGQDFDSSISEQVEAAIDAAMRAQGGGEVQ